MKTQTLVLPAILLGGTALLLAPARSGQAFSTLDGALGVGSQRQWRVFDNFADAQANNNVTPDDQFPGWLGAEMAIWKAASEWASRIHGDGTGDPVQTLGSGGANFDFVFSGAANAVGNTNDNIVSALGSCEEGVFAFVETPMADGWRMRVCDDEWVWSDGPGSPSGGTADLQAIVTHEFGHSLGLGHSGVFSATMFPSASGGTGPRSIAGDDQAGVQSIYGSLTSNKCEITSVSVNEIANTLTINGNDFSPTGNKVWFTRFEASNPGINPRIAVSDLSSSGGGTQIVLTIPDGAGPGDVHVKNEGSGHNSLSNGFPLDIEGTPKIPDDPTPPIISGFSPEVVESLIVGTSQTVTINGQNFEPGLTLEVDDQMVDPSRYTRVNDTTITLDMPTVTSLGDIDVTVTTSEGSDTDQITLVTPAGLVLQVGNGEPAFITPWSDGLDIAIAGPVGTTHYLLYSTSDVPSTLPIVSLDLGNAFSQLEFAFETVIPANGIFETHVVLGPVIVIWHFQTISLNFGIPIPTSNLQSAVITF